MILATIAPDDYVREVLPGTHGMWGGKRNFESYADDFRAMAGSIWITPVRNQEYAAEGKQHASGGARRVVRPERFEVIGREALPIGI